MPCPGAGVASTSTRPDGGSARRVPAASSPSPCGTKTSTSAVAALAIMCDSWPPTGSSTTSPSPAALRARTSSSRPGLRRTAWPDGRARTGAGAQPRPGARAPRGARTARSRRGRRPGCRAARTRACCRARENEIGLPGLTATRQNTSSAPSSASTGRTRSCRPTETPPEVTSTSASSAARDRGPVGVEIVLDRGEPLDGGARGGERGRQHEAVRLVDLAGTERLARRAQLGPRRENGDARPTRARELAEPCRRERPELSAPRRIPAGQTTSPARMSPPRGRTFAPGSAGASISTLVVMFDNILDGDDGIGAVGDDTARRDRDRLTGPERPPRGQAGRRAGDDRKRPGSVGSAHREAVHCRARERRQIDGRTRVGGQHPARRLRERHRLRLERAHAGEHERLRLLDRMELSPRRLHTLPG